eukprot:1222034-Rhodomonas_salina.1
MRVQVNNVFVLTPIEVDIAEQTYTTFALPAASTVSHVTLEEIMHRCMNHTPISRLVQLNCKVDGL